MIAQAVVGVEIRILNSSRRHSTFISAFGSAPCWRSASTISRCIEQQQFANVAAAEVLADGQSPQQSCWNIWVPGELFVAPSFGALIPTRIEISFRMSSALSR